MKKVLSFLLIFVFISCSSNTAVTNNAVTKATVTKTGSNSVVDELYGLDKVSYTTYAEYVDKAGGGTLDDSNIGTSKTEISYIDASNSGSSNFGTTNAGTFISDNSDAYYPNTNYTNRYDSKTDDMILIYYGNKKRLKWGKSELEKVVMHKYADGHREWFFPSFLYLEFKNDEGYKFGDNQPGEKGAANKAHWEWLLNRYFSTAYNGGNFEGLKALDECIEDCKKILGKPVFRHKVVLSVPSPCTDFTEWGSIKKNGRTIKLDFRNREHRLEAVKWYVDELIRRFEAQHYKNITLAGLYWIEETTSVTSWHKDRKTGEWSNMTGEKYDYIYEAKTRKINDIIADLGNYVHSKGIKFYWIPFNKAYGNEKWRAFGFDRCDMQTGYLWGTPDIIRKNNPLKTMSDARKMCETAMRDGKGMEFEVSVDLFVPCYGKLKNKQDIERPYDVIRVKDCKKTPNEMRALGYKQYNYNPCILQRLKNLMSIFEEVGLFDRSHISYYFSNSEILKMCNSTDKEIVEIVDRLARHISRRYRSK